VEKSDIERRFARTQKAASQRYREEAFCKVDPDLFYEIELPDGTVEQTPHYVDLPDDEMAYVEELSERFGNGD
jgi:hypothetical protein